MNNLNQEITNLKQQLEEFNDAIELLEKPIKYSPQNLAPLKILEADIEQANSEKERKEKLNYYKDIAAKSEAKLKELIGDRDAKEKQYQEMLKTLHLKGEKINKASEALRKELSGFDGAFLNQMKRLDRELHGSGRNNPLVASGTPFLPIISNSSVGIRVNIEKVLI